MRKKLTLRNQLLLWFLPITLIPMLFSVYFLYQSTITDHINDTYFKIKSIANTKADQIDAYFQERKNDVIAIALHPSIVDLLSKNDEICNHRASKISVPKIANYFKQYTTRFDVYDIILACRFGRILYSTTHDFGDDANLITGPYRIRESPLAHAYNRAIESKTAALSNINFFRPSQNLALFIAVPVFKNTEVIGAVIMQFNAATINALVSDYSALGESGEIGIATTILNEVIQVTSLRHTPSAAFNLRIKSKENTLMVDSTKDPVGSGEFYDYRQIKVFAAWKKLTQINWGLRVKIDVEEAMRPINNTFLWFFLFGISVLLILTTIIIIISKRLSAPISALTRASTQLAKGDLSCLVPDIGTRHDEIAELFRTFNMMAREINHSHQQLLDSNDALENKVIQRTIELQIAKENAEKSMQQAEIANAAKSHFLARISHELRTPLTSIIGYTEIIQHNNSVSQQDHHNIDIIHANSEHLLTLINDILDITKIEANKTQLKMSTFKLNDFIQSTLNLVSPEIDKKRLQLQLDLSDMLPEHITADKQKLSQVLINLLSNAIKFTDAGCIILSISFNSQTAFKGLLSVTVKDTGQGISAEEIEGLFQPFCQTESGINSKTGTGLGLHISQHFVKLMQSEIIVESTLGLGSNFHFVIPVDFSNARQEITKITQKNILKLASNHPKLKILVVDDIDQIRLLFVEHFKLRGITVYTANNGEEAIQQFLIHKPDLILMDFLMPVMNGQIAVKKIRLLPGGDQVKIIMVTASILEDRGAECINWGCDNILFKPIKIADVISLIEQEMKVKFISDTSLNPDML